MMQGLDLRVKPLYSSIYTTTKEPRKMPQPSEFAEIFVLHMAAKFEKYYSFTIESGSKYDRIVQRNEYGSGLCVHCFIEKKTGYVFKAASYAQPAKGVRFTDVFAAAEAADPYGSYLYAR
jgi:hypothetical protein